MNLMKIETFYHKFYYSTKSILIFALTSNNENTIKSDTLSWVTTLLSPIAYTVSAYSCGVDTSIHVDDALELFTLLSSPDRIKIDRPR